MIFRFADPWLLCGLILPVLVLWLRPARGGAAFGAYPLAAAVLRPSRGPFVQRCLLALALACLVVAAARPQYGRTVVEREQAGRDLMLVIDLSGSMRIDDLDDGAGKRSDRLAAVVKAAKAFVAKRPDDRVGLVFFGDGALTSCPLTYDHRTVEQFLDRTEQQQRVLWERGAQSGLLGGNTNLGLGLGTALKSLRDPKAKGRAIILVTDGVDSRQLPSWVDPLLAARQATRLGVRVYGIGVGNPHGTMTETDMFGRVQTIRLSGDMLPDMGRLQAIASQSDGKAFAANDAAGLAEVFAGISALEPTPHLLRQRDDFTDRWMLLVAVGLGLAAVALVFDARLRGVA
jgi:Ca-activated chloride channel family protein